MVVVSDSWVKNVATFPSPAMQTALNDMEMIITNNDTKMTAKAVLMCRQNSHPFQDRTLTLEEAIKVGRSVARARAKQNNAIFDCKVLSRNHAMLWYDNGNFFLQDTKSSNGTFVNNNKLTPETDHEVSSGDIVQFGVDVVENNRKVTHGCIIATLKLYLPDGKEAKASPSILENNRHGTVPLDELYRLNQIIQEASDREECLQKKLAKLQNMLQTAKMATSTCWAAYVGEERLLSRIATLETQLSQANKNWTEDRCKQELTKIQDENVAYQVAAIEALEKLHTEKLDAVAFVTELEIKENAIKQEADLAKMQLDALQKKMDDLLQNFIEEQKRTDDMRLEYEGKIQDLQAQLDEKLEQVTSLETKIDSNVKTNNNCSIVDELEVKSNYICTEDDVKAKKEMLENEEEADMRTMNSEDQHHITLTVGPVANDLMDDQSSNSETESNSITNSDDSQILTCINSNETVLEAPTNDKGKLKKDVKFDLPANEVNKTSEDAEHNEKEHEESESDEEKEHEIVDNIDSKTLKYHFQSTQNELKKKIEKLDQQRKVNQQKIEELEMLLVEEKKSFCEKEADNEVLKEELKAYKDDLERSAKENRDLKNEVNNLLASKEVGAGDASIEEMAVKEVVEPLESKPNGKLVSYDELVSVEEELVLLKERYCHVNEEKVRLQRDLDGLKKQYNSVRSQSHNMIFVYVAPLVLIVLYFLISNMFS